MHARARDLLAQLQTEVDVARPADQCSIAVQQTAEIAKALSAEARVPIMDEPTSALSEAEAERRIDRTMLKTTGAGRYVGVMLHVWNPRGGWWGEGDEKFFVDGEESPSTFGTGSEDYFGYAWSSTQLFQNCYDNQTISARRSAGHVSVNRWHIADNVPFHTGCEAAIEKYYPNSRPTLYASTAFWYQAPGQADPYEPVPVDQREGYWTAPAPRAAGGISGAIEGESLEVISRTGGQTQIQEMTSYNGEWGGGAQLWWTGARPDDKKVALDDAAPIGPIDLYNPGVVPSDFVDLGQVRLAAGRHKLTIQIAGANDRALRSYMVGLDYVRLEKAAD